MVDTLRAQLKKGQVRVHELEAELKELQPPPPAEINVWDAGSDVPDSKLFDQGWDNIPDAGNKSSTNLSRE